VNSEGAMLSLVVALANVVVAGWFAICPVEVEAAANGGNLSAAGPEAGRNVFTVDLQYADAGGHVQVRENDLEGTRLDLDDLGIGHAAVGAFEYGRRLSDVSSLRFRLRWFDESGRSTFPGDIAFNGGIYQGGASLKSTAKLGDFGFLWQRDLLQFGSGGRLQGLIGANLTLLDFTIDGPQVMKGDTSEVFYRQALPLPSLGLRVSYPLANDRGAFYAEAFGFTASNWNSLRKEGGTVKLSQDNAEATIGLRYRLEQHWQLNVGVRYDYLKIEEKSNEDGNVFRQRSWGPFVGIAARF